ncbi:unnamed protein product [Calicophoron daubneyi]|uniref:Ig-like domain-containing protein n=1 Tax=Calicophoron daubneyi TaxID=300641 RepID=A0AAV2SW10_CALDB
MFMGLHEGIYTCVANKSVRSQIDLQIYSRPVVYTQETELTFKEGEDFVVKCESESSPSAEFSWLMNGAPVVPNDRIFLSKRWEGSLLTVRNAQKSDIGVYTCTGKNAVGCGTAETIAVIMRPPEIIDIEAPPMPVGEGRSISMTCHVRGRPKPEINWKRNGKGAKQNKWITIDYESGEVTIVRALPKYSGTWTCEAVNAGGRAEKSVELKIIK